MAKNRLIPLRVRPTEITESTFTRMSLLSITQTRNLFILLRKSHENYFDHN